MGVSGVTSGSSSGPCIRSPTRLRPAPILPPGCSTLKWLAVNPRRSSKATAKASPSAICSRGRGGRHVERLGGFRGGREAEHDVGGMAERRVGRGDGDQGNRETLGVGDDRRELARLAGLGQRHHDIVGSDHAQVAVGGLGGMNELAPARQWRPASRRSCAPHGRTCRRRSAPRAPWRRPGSPPP